MNAVADLLRTAFREELGRRETAWLQDLELLGALKPIVWLLNQINVMLGRFFHGFVWVEEDHVVGNVTMTRLSSRIWLISNMAVHPDYRRRGIARELLNASIDWFAARGVRWVVLEVRRDNEAAKSFYRSAGFATVEGTTSMERHGVGSVKRVAPPDGFRLRPARPADSTPLYDLACEVTPRLAQHIDPVRRQDYRIGRLDPLLDGLRRLIGLPATRRWVATQADEQVVAMVKLRLGGHSHELSILIHSDLYGLLEESLITRALDAVDGYRGTVRAKVDADNTAAIETLRSHRFSEIRTLDRMARQLSGPRRIPVNTNSER